MRESNEFKSTWLKRKTLKELKIIKEQENKKNISDVIDDLIDKSGGHKRADKYDRKKKGFFPRL